MLTLVSNLFVAFECCVFVAVAADITQFCYSIVFFCCLIIVHFLPFVGLVRFAGTSTQARPMEEAAGGAAQSGLAESLDNWETKMLSAGGVGAGTAAGLLAHGAAGGGGGAGSRQQQLLLAAQQQQQQLLAGGHQLGQGQDRFRHRGLSLFVILLMCLLLALNVILLLKLWKLEEHIDVDLSRRARLPSLAALK